MLLTVPLVVLHQTITHSSDGFSTGLRSGQSCQLVLRGVDRLVTAVSWAEFPWSGRQDSMRCTTQTKLAQRHAAAELAYREAVARMKALRGTDFERAWRLVEHRRSFLDSAWQTLLDHQREHECSTQTVTA